jgi:uncharacterized membrane protein
MAEWNEGRAKKLFWVAAGMTAACAGVTGARILDAMQIWQAPCPPAPFGGILLWVLVALSILFGMDKGVPREGAWASRLLWMRRFLFVSALVAVFAVFKTGGT